MVKILMLFALLWFNCISTAFPAEEEVKVRLPISKVLHVLHMSGYDIITAIHVQQDNVVAEAVTPQGKTVKIIVNAYTGDIAEPASNSALSFSLEDAIKQVEGSGYHDVFSAECTGARYTIMAYDENDKKVKLKVDGGTGEINSGLFGL